MTRSRLVVSASAGFVSLGLGVALFAMLGGQARAAVGPLAPEGLSLPADTRVVMGLDFQRLKNSPFYKQQSEKARAEGKPSSFGKLEEKTGIQPERDIDQVFAAVGGANKVGDRMVMLMVGRFDQTKLASAIEKDATKNKVTFKKVEGTTVYLFSEGENKPNAFAFVDDHTLAFGSQPAVEEVVANHGRSAGALSSNAKIMTLLSTVKPGSTFWLAGDETALSSIPTSPATMGQPGSAAPPMLPVNKLKSLVITGDIDTQFALDAIAEAGDPAAAKQMADMVQGLLALAQFQAQQKPELVELAKGVHVSSQGPTVNLTARIPFEVLEALKPAPRAEAPTTNAEPQPAKVTR